MSEWIKGHQDTIAVILTIAAVVGFFAWAIASGERAAQAKFMAQCLKHADRTECNTLYELAN